MGDRPVTRRISIVLALGAVAATVVLAQPGGFAGGFAQRMQAVLAEPFVGLTADGEVEQGLYSLEPTGVSTERVRRAASLFLESLSAEQRARTVFPVDDSEWRNWANIHRFERQGVSALELSEIQRDLAYGLIRAGMSARGYQTSRDIMRLNHTIAEMVDNFDEYGEYLYNFTVMGEPSADEPWGWQLDGHHLIVNYFVIGDQVVMTPTFMGSEPVTATSGKYEGTTILTEEQDIALAFMQSLNNAQRRDAILSRQKSRGENEAEMMNDNVTIPYEGLPATRLDAAQRDGLLELIGLYVGQMADDHAAIKMEEVMAHLDRTYFAWKGDIDDDGVFYYRIHSPVIYIEFDHQGPTALSGERGVATRNHIHSVVRTPNGNDYGKDLLRQHLEQFAGDAEHGHSESALFVAR
ncbi:MAG: DUF3500 domain-containing protein [Gammaproteobacteria bacterium]|nr:DUF3500 domain-containing protein [Gammaproteobacteria bacterium]